MRTRRLKNASDFRLRAAECDRLALTSETAKAREVMQYIADRWRSLADEDDGIKQRNPDERWNLPHE
jgi:hypothetical protein